MADEGAPVAVNDTNSTTEDLPVNGSAFDNDSLIDDATLNSVDATSADGGTVTMAADGTYTYTPVAGFVGTDTFTYTICDDDVPTAECSTATVTITVADEGAPVAVNDTNSTIAGVPVDGSAFDNDSLIDDATLDSFDATSANGFPVVMNPDGTYTYTPAASAVAGSDTFTYTICDDDVPTAQCSTATVTITVTRSADLTIDKIDRGDTAIAGSNFTYQVEITNNGPSDSSGWTVVDTLPLGMTFVSGPADADITTVDNGSGTVTFSSDTDMANGESRTFSITVDVDPSIPDSATLSNTVDVSGQDSDPNPDNNNDIEATPIDTEIALTITKKFYTIDDETGLRVYGGPVEQDTNGFFELIVTNDGPSDAVDVLVTDTVTSLLTVVSHDSQPECAASSGQDVSCTFDIAVDGTVTVTVEYTAAEFLDPDAGSVYGTQEGDEFRIAFVEGYILEGSTDGGPAFLTNPDGVTTELAFVGTKNEIFFDADGDGPEAGFTIHLSCSDAFTGGWGDSAGPDEFLNGSWQIASYSILRYHNGGVFFKGCGDVVVPWDVSNTASADGVDSNSALGTDELVSDTATVQVSRQLKVEIRNQPVIKGKKMDVLLSNTGEDVLTITKIEVTWPTGNGELRSVSFGGQNTIWVGGDDATDAEITAFEPGSDLTIDPGEALKLGFFFQSKTKSGDYTVKVTFEGGLTTEVATVIADL